MDGLHQRMRLIHTADADGRVDERVTRLDARENDVRNVLQNRISGEMAVRVVNFLKVVDIDNSQCFCLFQLGLLIL